jgi:hypothetical protein
VTLSVRIPIRTAEYLVNHSLLITPYCGGSIDLLAPDEEPHELRYYFVSVETMNMSSA